MYNECKHTIDYNLNLCNCEVIISFFLPVHTIKHVHSPTAARYEKFPERRAVEEGGA